MCGHCGCHQVEAIGQLDEEHVALQEESHRVRRALASGDRATAAEELTRLVAHLTQHVQREERGLFTAMRDQGDFADEVSALEGEHLAMDAVLAGIDPGGVDFEVRVLGVLEELDVHIEREDLGLFPVSVVTLGAAGWERVARTHRELPSFLTTERTS